MSAAVLNRNLQGDIIKGVSSASTVLENPRHCDWSQEEMKCRVA
jgi:hypothetical protein